MPSRNSKSTTGESIPSAGVNVSFLWITVSTLHLIHDIRVPSIFQLYYHGNHVATEKEEKRLVYMSNGSPDQQHISYLGNVPFFCEPRASLPPAPQKSPPPSLRGMLTVHIYKPYSTPFFLFLTESSRS